MKSIVQPILAALAASTILAAAAHAAPGSLDATFGAGGKVTTGFPAGNNVVGGVALQADGKIVLAGRSNNGGGDDFAVARYTTAGSLDGDFDADGKVTTAIGGTNDAGNSVAVQDDGKIVVSGNSSNGANLDFALVRYNTDGSLDSTFSGDGKVTTAIGAGDDTASSMAIQGDGKIVVAGNSTLDFAVARYGADGALDTSFDGDGKLTTDVGGSVDQALGIALQADGKIVVAGFSHNGSDNDFAVTRYNVNGSLDTSFSVDGKLTTAISGNDTGFAVAIQEDGKVVVAGVSFNGGDFDFTLVRYNADGTLDTSFGGDGRVITDFAGENDAAHGITLQADGRILVAGQAVIGSTTDFALARYNADGSLDLSFDGDGRATTPIGGGGDFGQALAIQGDGRIVLAGSSEESPGEHDFAVARYNVALADARAGLNGTVPAGNNRYNLTGAGQTQNATIPRGGGVRTVFAGIQNDGPVASAFTVRGTPGNGQFRVKYLRGNTNVTGQVLNGTLTTGTLSPGAIYLLKAQITATTPLAGRTRNFSIIPTSAADPTAKDRVLIKARSN